MNALMRIQVQVINRARRELQAIQGDLAKVQARQAGAAAGASALGGIVTGRHLEKYSKNLQWTGRQIEYNFTIPLALAGAAATKFALDNEKAATRLRKVYGDTNAALQDTYKKELPQIEAGFKALSNIFGVAQADVIDIGADWAQAGSTGIAVLKQTRLTLEAMIIGEMDAAEATKGLIAIQAQYGLSTTELKAVLEGLNMVENQTAVSMSDLIIVFEKAAGSARSAGVDWQHLAASAAAIIPAAGGAERAGNALKTMFSRILTPTKDAADVLGAMGVSVYDVGWNSMSAIERLQYLADAMDETTATGEKVTAGQRAQVSALIASRWNITAFDVLVRELSSSLGFYQKALDASSDSVENHRRYVKELGTYLASSPQAFKILWTQLQNVLAEIILPLIPAMLRLASYVVQLVSAFTDLAPSTQQLIMFGLIAVAAIGPILRYVGAFGLLFARMQAAIVFVLKPLFALGTALLYVGSNLLTLLRIPFSIIASGIGLIFRALTSSAVISSVQALAGIVWTVFSGIAGVVITVAGTMVSAVVGALASIITATGTYGSVWTALHVTIAGAISNVWAAFRFTFGMLWGAVSAIHGIAVAAWPAIHAGITAVILGLWLLFTGQWSTLHWMMPTIVSAVGIALRAVWILITDGLAFIWGTMRTIWATLQTSYPVITAAIGTILTGVWTAISTAIVGIWHAMVLAAEVVGTLIMAAFTNPWIAIALAVGVASAAIVYSMRDRIGKGVEALGKAWARVPYYIHLAFYKALERVNEFPEGIAKVMRAALTIIRDAALAIYEWLSYINPFAHHSPSLVEQVTAGVDLIARKYASLRNIGSSFRKAVRDLKAFKDATSEARKSMANQERGQQGMFAAAAAPGAVDEIRALFASIDRLYGDLEKVGDEYVRQEAVVAKWKTRLDAANATLEQAETRLDAMRDRTDALTEALDAAQEKLDNLAETPIAGMTALEDKIFANEMAQKRLRLEMLRWEEINGPLADIEDRLSGIAGDIETLRGEAEGLRLAGAGSDITGPINAQVDALERQAEALRAQAEPMSEMQKRLDDLQRAGEIMDLEKSLRFDPMLRIIERLTSGMEELPFDVILAGIQQQQAEIARLTPQVDAATAAQKAQEAEVKRLTAARDALEASYDREKQALDELGEAYDAIEQQIKDMESALSDFAGSAQSAASDTAAALKGEEPSQAMKNFEAAGLGDFEIPGGEGTLGREEGDIDALVKQWEEESKKLFGDFDMFQPIKDMWNNGWKWVKEHTPAWVGETVDTIKRNLEQALLGAGIGAMLGSVFGPWGVGIGAAIGFGLGAMVSDERFSQWITNIKDAWNNLVQDFNNGAGPIGRVADVFRGVWEFLGPQIEQFAGMLDTVWDSAWQKFSSEFEKWAPLGEQAVEAFQHLVNFWKRTMIPLIGALIMLWKIVWPVLTHTLRPIFDAVINIVVAAFKILRGIFQTVLAVINGDWGLAWDGIKTIFAGIWDAIWAILSGAIGAIIGLVRGLIEGIISAFTWLWDVLVGHSIVPDLVNAVIAWFTFLWDVATVIFQAVWWIVENIVAPAFMFFWDIAVLVFNAIAAVIKWWWSNVVEPLWKAAVWYITNVLVPWFQFLWSVLKIVFEAIAAVIRWWWNNVVQPLWNAVKWYIENVLSPVFNWLKDRVSDAWQRIQDKIDAVWKIIKPIWQAIKDWIDQTLIPKFTTLKEKLTSAWDAIKDKIVDVWDTIKEKTRAGVNAGISAINTLIRGIKGVVDALPGDLSLNISEIPPLPERAQGGHIPPSKRVGGGFRTEGARAIVGEGRRGYPEYVIPTDPTYRSRAMGLFGRLGNDLGMPGYFLGGVLDKIPSPGDVVDTIRGTGARIAGGVVRTAYEPFSKMADEIIGRMGEDVVKKGSQAAKSKVDEYVANLGKDTDALAAEQAAAFAGAGTATGLHPAFVDRFNRWNAALGGKYRIGSGWRSYQQQAALYHAWITGVPGQAQAAKPGTSNHEKGLAIDLSPSSTTFFERSLGAMYGLRWPMSFEPWHVEPAPNIAAFLASAGPSPGMGAPAASATGDPNLKNAARQMLAKFGWGQDQFPALDAMWTRESGWRPTAQNPTSTAYGIAQFLDSTWAGVGGSKTSNPWLQMEYGMRYIKQRYGSPAAAWAFWQAHHWYDKGGELPSVPVMNFARGGSFITRPRPGGHLFRTSEGGQPEEVTVRPLSWSSRKENGVTYIDVENLVLPGITDPEDADKLIENLKSLGDG